MCFKFANLNCNVIWNFVIFYFQIILENVLIKFSFI